MTNLNTNIVVSQSKGIVGETRKLAMFCAYAKVMEYCAPKEETVTLNGEKYLLLNQREMCIQAFIMENKNQ